jgi:hypothetical protein
VGDNFPKLIVITPLFEKDDCPDATTKGWSMDRDRVTQGAVTDDCREAGGTRPRKGEVDRVGNKRSTTPRRGKVERVGNKRSRAMQELYCRGGGGDFLINPPRSPFFKGGGVFDEIPLFQRGKLFLTKSLAEYLLDRLS